MLAEDVVVSFVVVLVAVACRSSSVASSGAKVVLVDVSGSGQSRPAGVTWEKKPCFWSASMRSR